MLLFDGKIAALGLPGSASEPVISASEVVNAGKNAELSDILLVNSALKLINAGYQTVKFRFRSG